MCYVLALCMAGCDLPCDLTANSRLSGHRGIRRRGDLNALDLELWIRQRKFHLHVGDCRDVCLGFIPWLTFQLEQAFKT